VANLFNPFSALGDATHWLLELPRGEFAAVASALSTVLPFEEGARLRRNGRSGRIEVESVAPI
jgi:hypothetical protein